jgi:glycerol-3-phosphate dehydrogenase
LAIAAWVVRLPKQPGESTARWALLLPQDRCKACCIAGSLPFFSCSFDLPHSKHSCLGRHRDGAQQRDAQGMSLQARERNRMEWTQVVIIGGGATGAGILWDLSLRGISATLLEQGDIANGATGRCHGLLHSGGRYAVKDPDTARECIAENRIIKTIAPHCVEDIGGLFVQCAQDDPAFFDKWWHATGKAGIPTQRLSADEARELEPNLGSNIHGAFTCPDAHVDVFRLVIANLEAAVARGASFHTYSEVTAIHTGNGRVRSVSYRNTRSGEQEEIACDVVINAAGGWAQTVAALAGVEVPIRCDKGTLLVLNHRLSHRVINRCRKAGDADILVPAGPVCILGTSSIRVSGPDNLTASPEEIDALLHLGNQLLPGLADARVLRVFCGVRPLYVPKTAAATGGREISRGFALLDHEAHDGVGGFVSIVGGKLTTYRLMAAAVCDFVSKKLGVDVECTTDQVPLRPAASRKTLHRASQILPLPVVEKICGRLGLEADQIVTAIEARPELAEIVCECEMVTRGELEYVLGAATPVPSLTIADVGRRTRLGFGPCQGTFCGYKAMLAGFQTHRWSASQAANEFSAYLHERWKGQSLVHQGQQIEQLNLSHDLYGADLSSRAEHGE